MMSDHRVVVAECQQSGFKLALQRCHVQTCPHAPKKRRAIFRLCRAGKGEAKIGFIAFNWRGMKISRLPEKLRCGRCRETGHRDCCQGQIPGHPVDVHNCPSGHYCHYSSASESPSYSVLAATLLLSDVSADRKSTRL